MTEYPYGIMSVVNNDTARRKIENILQHQDLLERKFPVLDYGHVELMDWMGEDLDVAYAAWVSTEGAVTKKSPLPNFIDFLLRSNHTTPFEQCSLKFRLKLPMSIGEQVLRQRTAKPNKQSGRYVKLDEEIFTPEHWRRGNTGHGDKQSSSDIPFGAIEEVGIHGIKSHADRVAYESYEALLAKGVAPELARFVLPAGVYTSMVWKIDLHNLFKFLLARTDGHAQPEIQAYANVILEITEQLYPLSVAAWRNHWKNAVTFSQDEQEVLRELLVDAMVADASFDQAAERHIAGSNLRKSRQDELLAKLKKVLNG